VAGATEGDRTGVVTDYDDPAGIGTVTADEGDQHFFHCTAIADGSRTVEVGTRVRFTVVPGRLGRWEAAALRPEGRAT
jgi:cold shock CspA family protein